MEFSIKMLVVFLLVLVVLIVAIVLITGWSGQGNSAVSGLFKFFDGVLGGKQLGQMPSLPGK